MADDLKKMAVRDIPVGVLSSGSGTWDYSHLLTPEQRERDLRLRVRYSTEKEQLFASVHQGDKGALGAVTGQLHGGGTKMMTPHAFHGLAPEWKNKGLGRAMYEALYAHAYKKHGIRIIDGGYHTADARHVHERLAQKHGLRYNPEPGFPTEPGEDPRGGPYEYRLDGRPMKKAEGSYKPEDLADGVRYVSEAYGRDVQNPEFCGVQHMEPEDFIDDASHLGVATGYSRGWLNGIPRERWAEELRYGYDRPFDHIIDQHERGSMAPGVQIDGMMGDGRGRAIFHHAIGKPMPVAVFRSASGRPMKKAEGETCPKCGCEDVVVRVIGEPVFECTACKHHWEVPFPEDDLENSDIGTELPTGAVVTKDMVKAENQSFARGAMMKHPAFRHMQTGEVVESPGFHDIHHLAEHLGYGAAAMEQDDPQIPELNDWQHGFVDHAGKFYTREEAAKAVGVGQYGDVQPALESMAYRGGQMEGLYKSERWTKPRWVKHPELPVRIQRIFDAVRANLTPDLLQAQYQGGAHPLSGHCFVATQALYHLLDGKRTGWERAHVKVGADTHWFLRHKKTGVVLDPTAEQFPERPDYDKAVARPGPVGPPDYDPEKPTQRAQALIDRVKPSLKKAEDEDALQELAKTVGYITFPKLGVTSAQEPMTYGPGQGALARGRKGRDIFSARVQLANDPKVGGSVDTLEGQGRRMRARDAYDIAKKRGFGISGTPADDTKPTPPDQRSVTGIAFGGKVHGLVGTRAHEAQHTVFGQVAQKYGAAASQHLVEQLIQGLPPEGVAAGDKLMGVSGYTRYTHPEEFITTHQQFLTDEKSRKSMYKVLGLEREAQRDFFKLIRRNFEHMRQAARTMTLPRKMQPPKLRSKKLRKSEGVEDLAKSISAIPPGQVLAHNPITHESLHDYSHVLPETLRMTGYKLRVQHVPRTESIIARVYQPDGKRAGSLTTYHNVEQGVPVLGVDTAFVPAQHRGQGIGTALYEASYAFGRHALRARRVVGAEHSEDAQRVHMALARKHGLAYEPETRRGPYEYLLKTEEFQPQEAGDSKHELVKSEMWTVEDFEQQAQVLEKAARALPGQLSLFPDVVPPLNAAGESMTPYMVAQEAAQRQFQATGQLPPNLWGATWQERTEKGKLYQPEVDEFVRRITQPVPHPLGANALSTAPIWEESASERRPALTENNIRHFLRNYWEQLSPEQRSAVSASRHGDVSDWMHANHTRLSDEEFKRVIPTLTSSHFWSEDNKLSEPRVQMMLDYAKSVPRPEGEVPQGVVNDEEKERWYPWSSAWNTLADVQQYSDLSDPMSWKLLSEFPKDHPNYGEMMRTVSDSPGLSDEHRSAILDEVEEGAKDWAVRPYSYSGIIRGLMAHAQSPALQRRITDLALDRSYYGPLAEGFQHNKRLDPEVVRKALEHGSMSAVTGALRNPALPAEVLPMLAKAHGGDQAREVRARVAEHPAASEELVREIADSDSHRKVRQRAQKALAWHDPSSEHDEHVEVAFGTNKLRQIRDYIRSKGKDAMSPKELPAGDWKVGRDKAGNISADLIDQHIASLPRVKYGVSEGSWRGAQRHSNEPSYVFQLNLSTDQVRKLKEAGVYETFRRMHEASNRSGHPVGLAGLGWVRWTGDEKGVHIDEVQSDLGQSFVKQAAAQAAAQGQDAEEAAKRAEKDYPEEHYQKIRDIVFGGKHPSEVLQEAFHEWLRQEKPANRTGYNRYTGASFKYGGRKSYVGVPVHVWTPESKATISLHGPEDAKLPGHFYVGYRDVPSKKMGMKPAKYGDLPTQTSKRHKGKETWTDQLRKFERPAGAYVNLGKVER